MSKITVLGYQMNYPRLTDKLQKKYELLYKCMLYNQKAAEAEKGMIATRINKANSKGTKVTYKGAKNQEEMDEYVKRLNEEYAELNKK